MIGKLISKAKSAAKRVLKPALDRAKAAKLGKKFEQTRVIAAPASTGERLRFLAVGRQGYDKATPALVAAAMERVAAESPTHAMLILGDNFHPVGVKSLHDLQWRLKFEYLYDFPHLRGMPFFAVMGNHDLLGNAKAQIDYTTAKNLPHHTGRWQMPARWFARDFGQAGERVLLRVVFLDAIPLPEKPEEQLTFARDSFAAAGDPVWRVVVAHCGTRSLSQSHTAKRALTPWLKHFIDMKVDAVLAADDWFQQLVDYPGEPMSVSTNGGTYNNEKNLKAVDPQREFVASQPGFGVVTVDASSFAVELRDVNGKVVHARSRTR